MALRWHGNKIRAAGKAKLLKSLGKQAGTMEGTGLPLRVMESPRPRHDNRCVMHRRDEFDMSQIRILHRTQISGDRPR